MGILKYLMDFYYCLTSGKGVCWKGQSLETLKQTVPQQLLKSMEIYLTSAESGWKILERAATVEEQSYIFGQAAPHSSACGLCSGLGRIALGSRVCPALRSVCGDAELCPHRAALSQGCVPTWGTAHDHKLPAAPTSLPVIQQEKTTRNQHMNVHGNSEVQLTIEQKTSSSVLGRKPGVFE